MEKQESKKRFPTFPQPRRLRTITTYGIRILRARSIFVAGLRGRNLLIVGKRGTLCGVPNISLLAHAVTTIALGSSPRAIVFKVAGGSSLTLAPCEPTWRRLQ